MSYNKLYFNEVEFDGNLDNGIGIHFHCPVCGSNPSFRHWETVNTGKLIASLPTDWDYNGLRSFSLSSHNDAATGKRCGGSSIAIKIYVGVHKVGSNVNLIFSEEPIPNNWWVDMEVEP